ncbi:hypothetical protein PIB30_019904 [Stylosanthes scabra]|uniref:Uncharacterized protein n=1 Tax=Stylosanthes scabra TaxID=79078 RepID=A0ABU6V6K9_9FABA|nr:hypothetical protein [Stylosanthes scabra]
MLWKWLRMCNTYLVANQGITCGSSTIRFRRQSGTTIINGRDIGCLRSLSRNLHQFSIEVHYFNAVPIMCSYLRYRKMLGLQGEK